MHSRVLWAGIVAVALVVVLAGVGIVVWQHGPHRYATMAELNNALDAAGRSVTSCRTVAADPRGSTETIAVRDSSGMRRQMTSRRSNTTSGDLGPSILVITPEGAWHSASGLRETDRATLPPGKSWVAINSDAPIPAATPFAHFVRDIRRQPLLPLPYDDTFYIIDSAAEQLDGTPTYRYTLRQDLAKRAELETDPSRREALQTAARRGPTVQIALWVDAHDRPVRATTAASTETSNEVDQTIRDYRYSDWNTSFHIDPPPADQVYTG